MVKRLLLLLVWGLCFWACPARATDPCGAARTLEGLHPADRIFVESVCRFTNEHAEVWRETSPAEHRRLQKIAGRLVARSEWEASTLSRLLPGGAFATVGAPKIDDKCKALYTLAIRAAVAANDRAMRRTDPSERFPAALTLPPDFVPPPGTQVAKGATPDSCALSNVPSTVAPGSSTEGGTVRLYVVAHEGLDVRMIVGGQTPTLVEVKPLDLTPKGGAPTAERTVHVIDVPYNARYVTVIEPRREDGRAKKTLPTVVQGFVVAPTTIWSDAGAAGCVDIQVASDEPVTLYFDGVELELDRDGQLSSSTLWVPTSPGVRRHRLTAMATERDEGASVLLSADITFDPAKAHECVEAYYDLTTRDSSRTIGILDVDTDACIDAGIDSTKLRAFVSDYLASTRRRVSDLRSWSSASRQIADFRASLDRLGGTRVGAARGRLDSIVNLATGAEELLRQGFAELLNVQLRCTRRPGGWDYSFVAQSIDLGALASRPRNALTGIDLDDVVRTGVELVTEREQLAADIEGVLADLFGEPWVRLLSMPAQVPFLGGLFPQVELLTGKGPRSSKTLAVLSLRVLSRYEQSEVCGRLDDMHTLRSRRDYSGLDAGVWESGKAVRVESEDTLRKVQLAIEPTRMAPTLLRATLHRVSGGKASPPIAASYRCVDLSRDKAEAWVDVGGWFPLGGSEARTENSGTFFVLVGIDWQNPLGWVGFGAGLGYSHTVRNGLAPPSWNDLDESPDFEFDGELPYSIVENGGYTLFHAELKATVCELSWRNWCNAFSRRVLATTRLMLLPGLHIVEKDEVPRSLTDFRGGDPSVLLDVGAFVQPGFAVRLGSSLSFHGRLFFGANRWLDVFSRSADDSSAYRQALWGLSAGASWDF